MTVWWTTLLQLVRSCLTTFVILSLQMSQFRKIFGYSWEYNRSSSTVVDSLRRTTRCVSSVIPSARPQLTRRKSRSRDRQRCPKSSTCTRRLQTAALTIDWPVIASHLQHTYTTRIQPSTASWHLHLNCHYNDIRFIRAITVASYSLRLNCWMNTQ